MLRIGIVCLSVALACPALAKGGETSPCKPFDQKRMASDGFTLVKATPGQFHFLQGIWAMDPRTPPGLPPGDNALLVTRPGTKGGVVIWMSGKLACAPVEMPEALFALLSKIKTGALDATGDEL